MMMADGSKVLTAVTVTNKCHVILRSTEGAKSRGSYFQLLFRGV